MCLTVLFDNLSPGPLWSWALYFIRPCISSPNHHLLAARAHTIAACSAVIQMLRHLYLVSLPAPYLEICHQRFTCAYIDAARMAVTSKSRAPSRLRISPDPRCSDIRDLVCRPPLHAVVHLSTACQASFTPLRGAAPLVLRLVC